MNFSPLSVTSESFIYYEIRDNSLASCLLTILERTKTRKIQKTKRRIKLEKIGIDLFVVTKAIFSYDLRDVQYPFVLFCETYPRTVGIRFHSAMRHMLVASIARSKDCRYTRIIERGKRYVILFTFVFTNRNVYNRRWFCCA